ncbi:hypothetical protein [Cellulomonas fimi]|uniref:hypothetical protein n=1 Tax=Cellulomonas fimi TaxID=1708 RepID=UPI0023584916|nr:hypothetical protein [Cellulomonas fimi]
MPLRRLDVLADQPFAEIGDPTLVVDDPAYDFVVVAGDLPYSQWFGAGTASRAHARVGVYGRADLVCRQLATLRRPANDVAIHPSGTLVAVGTGAYDGGYSFEGELVLLDLERARRTSPFRDGRQVRTVRWVDDQRLAVVLAPWTDDDVADWKDLVGDAFEVQAPWHELRDRELDLSGHQAEAVPFVYPEPARADARAALERLAAETGRTWTLRRAVWSVAGCPDGSVVAACEGVAAERWDATGGDDPRWRITTTGTGCQLTALDATTVATTVELRPSWADGRPLRRESQHHVVDHATGVVVGEIVPESASVAVGSTGPYSLLRPATRDATSTDCLVIDPAGRTVGRVPTTGYDPFNHWFDVAGAPVPVVLVGSDARKPHLDKWVARVVVAEGGPVLERLFPLDWQGTEQRHLFGGPGVYVDDELGTGVVHCGEIHAGSGSHSPFAVRRDYPDGAARWTLDLPGVATDAVHEEGVVVLTTSNGWLVRADATTGALVEAVELEVHGSPVVPLSVTPCGPGRLAVGLLDGRILRLEVGTTTTS